MNQNSSSSVTLRPIEEMDLFFMRVWRNDPRVFKWCRQFEPISDRDHSRWFESIQGDNAIRMYAVTADSDLVGVCGLTSIDYVNSRAEFSLYIDPEQHGKGYGKAALEALLDKAFNVLNLNLVWGESFQENPATQMFSKVGFTFDGGRRSFYYRDGKYIDAWLYSITKDEYVLRNIRRIIALGDPICANSDVPPTDLPVGTSGFFHYIQDPITGTIREVERQETAEGE